MNSEDFDKFMRNIKNSKDKSIISFRIYPTNSYSECDSSTLEQILGKERTKNARTKRPEDVLQDYDSWRMKRVEDLQQAFKWCTDNDYFIPEQWAEEYIVHLRWIQEIVNNGKKG